MASDGQNLDARGAVTQVKLLLNKNLISILKDERLPHTGVKAAMQNRVISRENSPLPLCPSAEHRRSTG